MKCPDCHAEMEPVIDEVDIGVGIQQHLRGYECPGCGTGVGACDCCGELAGAHHPWCNVKRGDGPEW